MTDQGFESPTDQPIGYGTPSNDQLYRKWRSGGLLFGVIAVVLGSLCACVGVLTLLSLVVPRGASATPPQIGQVFTAMAMYVAAGAALIWLGIGAMKMRRWVRPLVLIIGIMMLLTGFFGLVSGALFFRKMTSAMAAPPTSNGRPLPPAFFTIMLAVILGIMGLFLVVIPAAFVWFYKKREVKAALEYYDPTPRWTDRCPISVLGLATGLTLYGILALLAAPTAITPIFGRVLHGPPAVASQLAIAIIALSLARPVYRVRMAGWWGSLIFLLALTVAYGMTALKSNQTELYRAAGYTDQQLQMLQKLRGAIPAALVVGLPWFLLLVGYILYVRKYFTQTTRTRP